MIIMAECIALDGLDALERRITSENELGVDAIHDLDAWLGDRRPDWYVSAASAECERAQTKLALAQSARDSWGDLDEESRAVSALHRFEAAEAIRKALDYARRAL